jgi:hypothetical protein
MKRRAAAKSLFAGFATPKRSPKKAKARSKSKPKSLFEALRSKRAVRGLGVGLVLVMGSTFAALQANAVDPGADSVIDNYLQVNVGGATNQSATHPETGYLTNQANVTWERYQFVPLYTYLNEAQIHLITGLLAEFLRLTIAFVTNIGARPKCL